MNDSTQPIDRQGAPASPPPWAAGPAVPPAAGQDPKTVAPPWAGAAALAPPPGPPRRSWFARHKALTAAGAAAGLFVGLGAIGAAAGETADGSGARTPVAAVQSATSEPAPAAATTAAPAARQTTAAPAATVTREPATTAAAPSTVNVPDVVGTRLDAATGVLATAGLSDVVPADATGQKRAVVNPTNWVVTSQQPAAGTRVPLGTSITLGVEKPSDSGGGGTVEAGRVPDVVCKDLQAAQDTLQAAGYYNLGSEDGSGQGRAQLVDRNWVVVKQSVAPGSSAGPTKRIVLTSVKYGEPTGASGCPS